MNKLTKPLPILGDYPGLLRPCTPVWWRDSDVPHVVLAVDGDFATVAPMSPTFLGLPVTDRLDNMQLHWESGWPAIMAAALAMEEAGWSARELLPVPFGGVQAGAGMSEVQLSALLLSIALVRERVPEVFWGWRLYDNGRYGRYYARNHLLQDRGVVGVDVNSWWVGTAAGERAFGPETGEAGKEAADRAAVELGAVLICDDGVLCKEAMPEQWMRK